MKKSLKLPIILGLCALSFAMNLSSAHADCPAITAEAYEKFYKGEDEFKVGKEVWDVRFTRKGGSRNQDDISISQPMSDAKTCRYTVTEKRANSAGKYPIVSEFILVPFE